jgi:predicted Na+-dependent transporter
VFSVFSLLVVLLIIANAVSNSAGRIGELGLRITYIFLFMLLLHAFVLLMNFGLARAIRLDPASASAFTIHVSQKTLTVTYVIWAEYFSAFTMAMIPSISYHLIQVIGDTFVAHRFREAAD